MSCKLNTPIRFDLGLRLVLQWSSGDGCEGEKRWENVNVCELLDDADCLFFGFA